MTSNPTSSIRITELSGLLACVPTLLGFQPERSIVVLCLAGNRVALSMRVDLDGSNVSTVAETAVLAARRAGASDLVAVGYIPRISKVITEVLRDLAIAVENLTIDDDPPLVVRHMAAVGRDGWCEVPAWESEVPSLRPLAELTDHPVRAQQVFEGRAVARSRKDIAARVAPDSEQRSTEFEVAAEAVMLALPTLANEVAVRLISEHLDEIEGSDLGEPVDDVTMGRLAALLAHPLARDEAMLRIDGGNARRYVEVWSRLARLVDGQACLAALFLAGTAAWVSGDGAVVNCCAEAGARIDPGHVGVQMLTAVTDHCLPPEVFDSIKADARKQA